MKVLTHWLSPVQGDSPGSIKEACDRARKWTPPGWAPRLLVPVLYGIWWQSECNQTLSPELRAAGPSDVTWIRDLVQAEGLLFGCWGVPRTLSYQEGQRHGEAAALAGIYVLDLEPYGAFLEEPSRPPEVFIEGFLSGDGQRPEVSVVPNESGIGNLKAAWGHWAQFASRLRTQCYWTDSETLAYPEPATSFIKAALKRVGISRPVTPIFPRQELSERTATLLSVAGTDRDIWVLGG